MIKIVSKFFVVLFILCFVSQKSFAKCGLFDFYCKRVGEENSTGKSVNDIDKGPKKITNENNTEFNVFAGMFDFSDHGQRASLVGVQHQDEELYRNSFLGKLSPITGAFLTKNNAVYLYTGVQAEYNLGFIKITPSFAPGYYNEGNGKDLGSPLEFKSEVQMSFNLSDNSQMGMSYNHISNASLGDKNPGANSYMFNFLKQF